PFPQKTLPSARTRAAVAWGGSCCENMIFPELLACCNCIPLGIAYKALRIHRKAGKSMLRSQFQERLKQAQHAKDAVTVATLRLILAALQDRDISARAKGNWDGIPDD